MKQGTRLIVMLLALLAVGMALPACGGGSSGGDSGGKDLYLRKFMLVDENYNNIGGSGTTNAFRNTRILFVFNEKVDLRSVNSRTIRIGIPTGDDLFLEAPGRFEQPADLPRNHILFNPTFTKNNLSNDENDADNPFGLDGDAIYEVEIPAFGDQPKVLSSESGKMIVKHFHSQFQTSEDYLQTLTQPELEKTEPADGDTGISATADIVLTFSEAMKPDSFILGNTIIVRNLTLDREVLGILKFSPDAKQVIFRPVFGYGKGPYQVYIRVKRDVTNLAGNPIPKEARVIFTTALDTAQPDFEDVTEDFETNTMEDTTFQTAFPLANWDVGVTSGLLSGTLTSGTLEISKGQTMATRTYSWPPFAWGNSFASQWQTMYTSAEVGTARTITGFQWYYRALTSSNVSSVTVNLGHTKLGGMSTNFPGNFSDAPITVVNNINSYSISNSPTENWMNGPNFSQNWKYNGTDNVVLEIFNTCGTIGWNATWVGLWRVYSPDKLTRSAYTLPAVAGGGTTTATLFYDIRFNYLIDQSEAQSKFYDTGIKTPQFLEVVLFPDLGSQPAGTISSFEFQGAHEDPLNPGNPFLDNLSDWNSDLVKLSGYRFIRFHANFKVNQQTGQVPAYDSLVFPFIFF